jgi:selenoprotein W-related protein
MTLVPASGGCFELKADGELLYSKLETGQFPDEKAVVDMIGSRLRKKKK